MLVNDALMYVVQRVVGQVLNVEKMFGFFFPVRLMIS